MSSTTSTSILQEAKRLHDLNFGVHWIRPNSKVPVKAGWSKGERDSWATLKKEFKEGYGLGVRLGALSNLGDGYLANIDVDIKSEDPKHRKEALLALEKNFPGLVKVTPIVKTGMGLRLFIKTPSPVSSRTIVASGEEVKVKLPGTEVNRRQKGKLSEEELSMGYRVRPAWEIDLMSAGKQVVLPPSVHPETKKLYAWARPLISKGDVPLQEVKGSEVVDNTINVVTEAFTVVKIPTLPDGLFRLISGDGVTDRSAACFSATLTMLRLGLSDNEILTVLTEPSNYLGKTGYDHSSSNNRAKAAEWIRKYCLEKAKKEVGVEGVFTTQYIPPEILSEKDIKVQLKELIEDYKTDKNWKDSIKRGKNGYPLQSLENAVLILENAIGKDLFKRNEFNSTDIYGKEAPWHGAKKGKLVSDDDIAHLIHWIGSKYKVEHGDGTIYKAITILATKNAFHPLREELLSLPEWDGKERLNSWLKEYFEAHGPEEYLGQVFRKWLTASVTRVFEPGTKFDWMPILQGEQGTGKSSFGSILFGEKYFNDWLPDLSDKDAALGLLGIRCHEFGELDSLRKNEVDTIKAFVTRTTDKVRPPYGRKTIEIARQCVFFGTTNRDAYLKDDTGNRRFMPVEVGRLDFKALHRDRSQLWAEALFRYQNCLEATFELEGTAKDIAKSMQKEKLVQDESAFMVEELKIFFKSELLKPKNEQFDGTKFKLLNLFGGTGPLGKWPQNGKSIQQAGNAVKSLGGVRRKIKGHHWWEIDYNRLEGEEGMG